MSQTPKIILGIIIAALLIGGAYYFWRQSQSEITPSETVTPTPEAQTTTLTIMVPENPESYQQKMTDYAQLGGPDPAATWNFVPKQITVPYTDDLIKASANAAAAEFPTGGGPNKAEVVYLKIIDGTAYVLMNIDIDGWAGVSVSLAIIHPVVEKTLLQFAEIENIVFGYAPGDSLETINYNPDSSSQ